MAIIVDDGGIKDESSGADGPRDSIFTDENAARWGITYEEYQNWYKVASGQIRGGLDRLRSQYGDEIIVDLLNFASGETNEDLIEWNLTTKYGLAIEDVFGSGRSGGSGPTKAEQFAAAEAVIRNMVGELGYATFKEEQIKALARTVVNGDWSSDQLTDYLVTGATSNWKQLKAGTLTAAVDAIKATANSQLVGISDATAQQYAARLMSGEMTEEGLRSLFQQQAATKFGWAAEVINKGITMEDFLAPSRDRIAQELELDANTLSLTDPKILAMMTVKDDKTGMRVATDTELVQAARKDSRWRSTNNAREMTAQAAMMVRQYLEGN